MQVVGAKSLSRQHFGHLYPSIRDGWAVKHQRSRDFWRQFLRLAVEPRPDNRSCDHGTDKEDHQEDTNPRSCDRRGCHCHIRCFEIHHHSSTNRRSKNRREQPIPHGPQRCFASQSLAVVRDGFACILPVEVFQGSRPTIGANGTQANVKRVTEGSKMPLVNDGCRAALLVNIRPSTD